MGRDVTESWMATLAMLVMPMQIFIMARVPSGDVPSGAGRVRLGALLAEFAGFVAIHTALALVVLGPAWVCDVGPISALQLAWGLAVAALVSIRVVAAPARLPALVWAGFAYVVAIVTFATGVGNIAMHRSTGHSANEILLALWEVSPALGLGQLALTLAIPVLFVRALQRPAAGVDSEVAPAKDPA
jgi:hypothetical protein